jgi:hypothetical protein
MSGGYIAGIIKPSDSPDEPPTFQIVERRTISVDPDVRPCEHRRFLLDEKWKTVTCEACKERVDPFAALMSFATWYKDLEHKRQMQEEAERNLHRAHARQVAARKGLTPEESAALEGGQERTPAATADARDRKAHRAGSGPPPIQGEMSEPMSDELSELQDRLRRGEASDGYHTHRELYEYRMLYNAHAAHGWVSAGVPVVKSRRHSDGEPCFGGGWFIVVAELPTGQVSNHYRDEHWDLFNVPEAEIPPVYDGHTPADAATRLRSALQAKPTAPHINDCYTYDASP